LPRSASDRNQIIDYTLRSIKNRTDQDKEPNSLGRDNLCHSARLRWTIQVSTVTAAYYYIQAQHGQRRKVWGEVSQLQQQHTLGHCNVLWWLPVIASRNTGRPFCHHLLDRAALTAAHWPTHSHPTTMPRSVDAS